MLYHTKVVWGSGTCTYEAAMAPLDEIRGASYLSIELENILSGTMHCTDFRGVNKNILAFLHMWKDM